MSEYKFKLSKAEQEMGTMEQNVSGKETTNHRIVCTKLKEHDSQAL